MFFFFFNDTATTEIYTLSLHDALPIFHCHPFHLLHLLQLHSHLLLQLLSHLQPLFLALQGDRKSTRLNSSHANISYAVFCLKKKKLLCTLFSFFPSTVSSFCLTPLPNT